MKKGRSRLHRGRAENAKGREILSEEEKARRDEKERKAAAEVFIFLVVRIWLELIDLESSSARRTCAETVSVL